MAALFLRHRCYVPTAVVRSLPVFTRPDTVIETCMAPGGVDESVVLTTKYELPEIARSVRNADYELRGRHIPSLLLSSVRVHYPLTAHIDVRGEGEAWVKTLLGFVTLCHLIEARWGSRLWVLPHPPVPDYCCQGSGGRAGSGYGGPCKRQNSQNS